MSRTPSKLTAIHCILLSLGLITALLVSGISPAHGESQALQMTVLSSPRPDMISDGNVLVRVRLGPDISAADVTVRLGQEDVSDTFTEDASGTSLTGLVEGLDTGKNVLTAEAGAEKADLEMVNHARSGPMFAGTHETPFACQTDDFTTLAGNSLGAATDANCSAPTQVDYLYRSTTDRSLKPLPSDSSRPDDLAMTTTRLGKTVPYIVRVETGVINRSIYEYAVLHDPEGGEPTFRHRPSGWNDKIIYTFGGGCTRGWYKQGSGTGGVGDDVMLGRGYAVVSSSLNVFGNNCNGVLAAETMAMTKEHVVETIGEPDGTIGWGCSGGSYQVFQIGDNYPGLLDGIVAGCVFPEVAFATLHTITDARLLDHFFQDHQGFTDAQKRAVSGFGVAATLPNLADSAKRIDPTAFCPAELPEADRYHPDTNPDGARCDVYDHQVNIWGENPRTGAARRPLDNVGIQYGLDALAQGAISASEFADLNADLGGLDEDAQFQEARNVADPQAIRTAYRTGQLTNGGGGLATMPILDFRRYTDEAPNGDIHLRFHSFSFRERLRKANGDAGNAVMQVGDGTHGAFSTANPRLAEGLEQIDQWVDEIAEQNAGDDHGEVVAAKPAALTDACWTPDGEKVVETQVDGVDTTRCNTLFPSYPSPRQVAGAAVTNDIIKCQLKPLARDDYDVSFTDDDWAKLQQAFPKGVCNWDAPGRQQQDLAGEWPTF